MPLLMILLFASCEKSGGGKDLLPAKWGILTFRENGLDKTIEFGNNHQAYYLNFDAKGNFTESYHNSVAEITVNGTWTLDDDKMQLMLVDNDPNSSNKVRTYNVMRLNTDTLDISLGNAEYDLRKL
jgi:hypothetical protein